MIFSGADIVLRDRVLRGGTLVVDGDRIAAIEPGLTRGGDVDVTGRVIAPGLIDVHVHGAAGHDVLDGAGAVAAVAATLPRWGVTAFSPTSIACAPDQIEALLAEVAALRRRPPAAAARVLPAHLESNFISPHYRGAQPLGCLRTGALDDGTFGPRVRTAGPDPRSVSPGLVPASETRPIFSTRDILAVIDRHRSDISAITMAPEIPGGLDLVRAFVAGGIAVSLGHSGATFNQANDAIQAGASRATHLFNRMPPLHHREPGLAAAVLTSDAVSAELICDGVHVNPAMLRLAIAAKGAHRILAITDGTAGTGLAAGSRTRLGGQTVTIGDVARLDDGTIAGSVATMDRVLACLLSLPGVDIVRAVEMCATTPARVLGLVDQGALEPGARADFVIFSEGFTVLETWIGGRRVYPE